MSTHSNIAVKTNKGYETIYCHNDGYPSYMYPMLRDWYGTQERAEALISFGDASVIDKRLVPSQDSGHSFDNREQEVCIFYHRDRGDAWEGMAPVAYAKEKLLNGGSYVYIFEDGAWHVYMYGREAEDYSKFD